MKKIIKLCVCGLAAATLVAGCSKKEATTGTTAETTTAATTETTAPAETVDLSQIPSGTITLGKYKGVEVTMAPVEVTDEALDAQIKQSVAASPDKEVITDRGVQDGDIANINYTGTLDGVAFDGGSAENFDFVVGTTSFIDGFKDGLMGAKTGDKLPLNLTFPAEYPNNPDLAGKAVVFDVTVNSISVKKPSVLDDAFVQRVSEFKTVDEYKENMKQQMLAQLENEAEQQKQSDILTAVINDSKIEANQEAIDANYNMMVENYSSQAAMYGMDLATMASMYGMDEEQFKETIKVMSDSAVKQRLVFNAVAEQESITVTDQDRDDLAAEMQYENAAAMVTQVGEFTVDDYIISTKAMDFLTENAVVK